MTEPDYLASDDPDALLVAVGGGLSRRKLTLFACGCLRLVPFKATDRRTRQAIDLIELHADDAVPAEKVADLTRLAWGIQAPVPFLWGSGGLPTNRLSYGTAMAVNHLVVGLRNDLDEQPVEVARQTARMVVPDRGPAAQARVFREVAGNPFRPAAFDPAWRTSVVISLAEAIQADRGFDRLPILADALEEAGCGEPELLAHFRGPGTHARGCWALDLVLGKG